MTPEATEAVTGVPADAVVDTARTLWTSRPVAFYSWSGLEQHANTTQMIRGVNVLYALTGCLDAPGGNVLFTPVPTNPIDGLELLGDAQRARAIGVDDRPLGPARFEFVTGEDFYTAALEHRPYRARALVNFGANMVMAHGDSARGRDALASLDFFVHADLFLNPTADLADIVLPVAGPFETEALRVGFEVSQPAQSHVQLRRPVVAPRGEARSDQQIVFALADRLGLGEHFWDGDLDAAWRHQLAPSGLTLEALRAQPRGITVDLSTAHRKHEGRGFRTPTGLVELYSQALAEHGQPAMPTFAEPPLSPRSRPDLAAEYPLVLTCAKSLRYCESQHRQIAELRRAAPDPQVEVHPDTAAARGITAGDWVRITTPHGSVTRASQAQRRPRPGRGVRPARLVAGVRRARPASLGPLRAGRRQPEPGAAADPQRSGQRQLAVARVPVRPRTRLTPPSHLGCWCLSGSVGKDALHVEIWRGLEDAAVGQPRPHRVVVGRT